MRVQQGRFSIQTRAYIGKVISYKSYEKKKISSKTHRKVKLMKKSYQYGFHTLHKVKIVYSALRMIELSQDNKLPLIMQCIVS